MKIGFVTDTNLLKKNKSELYENKNFLNDTDFFIDYIESLEKTDSKQKLVYFMPNIIIEELYQQKVKAFEVRYNALLEQYNKISYGLTGEIPINNIKETLNTEKKQYLEKYKIIDLEYSEELFKELVADALCKKPPFDKSEEGKKADSGYKDALIWKTILYNSLIDECDKLYFFSCDNIFEKNEKDLNEEFEKHHPKTELIIKFFEPDGQQRQNSLQTIISENNLIETEIIQLYNIELILGEIKKIKYDYDDVVEYLIEEDKKIILENINFEKFSKGDFFIKEVKQEGEKYRVTVRFETKKYMSNDEIDSNNKKMLLGKIILIFEKKKQKFKLIEYNIKNVEFFVNYFSILSNSVSKILTNVYSDTMKKTIEALTSTIAMTTEPFKRIQEAMSSMTFKFNNNDTLKMLSKGIIESARENDEKDSTDTDNNEEDNNSKEEMK